MSSPRQPLFERLPEIYRIRDTEQQPPGQLEAFVGVMDEVFRALRDDIEGLYHNLFIDTCDDWVVPYIADLLGTSHLSGDPWTLRADVARTVYHRRRKGTLGAIESLAYTLTGWAAHAVEMREQLVWNQHLNHQRPDRGGTPPLTLLNSVSAPVRGGTVNLRDPAQLSLLNGPFDPFAHTVDVKPPGFGYNLPTLAIFLWRLKDYLVPVSKPLRRGPVKNLGAGAPDEARFAVRFDLHPLGDPMVLFNRYRFHANDEPPNLSLLDEVPGPMPRARLTTGTPAGNPDAYVQVQYYAAAPPPAPDNVGLTFHLPDAAPLNLAAWRFRGANLCAWEAGLNPRLKAYEIAVDPERGRVVFGLQANAGEAQVISRRLLVSATYGAPGPTGAHPVQRPDAAAEWGVTPVTINGHSADPATALQHALDNLADATGPVIIEIDDSLTHDLDLTVVAGIGDEGDGKKVLRLAHSLWIRAASGQRPVIRLKRPLAFRPDQVTGAEAAATMATLAVRLEGLYLARADGFVGDALIERAALDRLWIQGCTLDPGGALGLDGVRKASLTGMKLGNDYGFTDGAEETAFDQTPTIILEKSVCGPLQIDSDYELTLENSILDAGSGVFDEAPALAVGAASGDAEVNWGPRLTVRRGMTCFGRMRVWGADGEGGIWVHRLEVHDTLAGCIRFSYFSGDGDRLPQHHGCVFGPMVRLAFVGEAFGLPGYAQLRGDCDRHIVEQGPEADQMGAFGYLLNSHKLKNISIRSREFMPLGVRPVLISIT